VLGPVLLLARVATVAKNQAAPAPA